MQLPVQRSNMLLTVVSCSCLSLSFYLTHVNADYAERLSIGTDNAQEVISEVVGKLMTRQAPATRPPTFNYCPYLNESICPATARLTNTVVPVVAYNPLAWTVTHNFRIPVPVSDVTGTGFHFLPPFH